MRVLNRLEPAVIAGAIDFLASLQSDQGGFQAALDYVQSMQQPEGGFRGFEFDPADDVEYTFYGLGTLALLASV